MYSPTQESEDTVSGTQTKASPSDIRISNITAAFKQLFPATQMSRANIGKLIGLSRFTTSEVTGEIVDNRILRELGPDNREGRGKRSQVLAIDTDFWRIVSIDLSNPKLAKGALADLSGRIVDRTELPADNGCSVDDVISLCKQLIASTPLPILGIGIAVTGIVEPDGIVRKSVHLEWNELPLKTEVEKPPECHTGRQRHQRRLVAERFFGTAPQFHAHLHRTRRRCRTMPQRRHHRRKLLHGRRNRACGGRPKWTDLRMRQTRLP